MGMKLWGLVIGLALLCGGCAVQEPAPQPEPAPEEPAYQISGSEFRLTAVPELEPFTPFTEISGRYYNVEMDGLMPRNDYGVLYPFVGRIVGRPGNYETTLLYYGLCDGEGKIVVDPVYTGFSQREWQDGRVLYSLSSKPVAYQPEGEGTEYTDYYHLNTILPPDGSWVIQEVNGYIFEADGQAIIIAGNNLDWGSIFTTNYIYTPEGKLRATLPDSTIAAYADGCLVIGEPGGADGEPVYRIVDLDGKTVAEEADQGLPADHGGLTAITDENGLWGLADESGAFISEERYSHLYYSDYTGLYSFTSADGLVSGLLDPEGTTLLQMNQSDGWFSVRVDQYTGEKVVDVYHSTDSSSYLLNLDTGEESAVWQNNHWLSYLGNGWYFAVTTDRSPGEGELFLMRWGDPLPVYTLPGADSVMLEGEAGNIAAVTYYSVDPADNSSRDSVAFFDLETGKELSRQYDCYYAGYCEGLGYLLTRYQDWQSNAYDALGNKLLPDSYYAINAVGGGWYSVYNDIYAGLIDQNGQWLIRFCVANTD